MIEFFIPGPPPTVTHQQHQIAVRNGRPVVYDPRRLKAAREQFRLGVYPHRPEKPLIGPLRLVCKWCFPLNSRHRDDGEYKATRPDTDNLQKLLKDVMTVAGFWQDDAQVASEISEKFYAAVPGIYIRVETL